jgi:Gamma-glutamyl cyclotransferase, AIG2-like
MKIPSGLPIAAAATAAFRSAPTMALSSQKPLFVYGTLMAPEVVQTLIGRAPVGRPARLVDRSYTRHPVQDHVFPGLIRRDNQNGGGDSDGSGVCGILYNDLNADEMIRLDAFEGEEYVKESCRVQLLDDDKLDDHSRLLITTVEANLYRWANPVDELDLEQAWSYETFRSLHLAKYLTGTVQHYRDA